jgi:hypothetical protein
VVGAKTEILAFADGDTAEALRRCETSDPVAAASLVRRLAPGWQVEPTEDESLAEATYPPMGIVYVLSVPGLDIVCGLDFMRCNGSALPERVLTEGTDRTIIFHRMHSGTDSVEIALWNEGILVRAIGIDGVSGVVEDVGEPLPFEAPFWAGQHPHEPEKFIVGAGPSPFPTPFHPLDLGNEAVRALFGFIVEGRRSPNDVDPWTVRLHGFRVTNPDAPSLAELQASMRETAARGTLTSYHMELAPDGRIVMVPKEFNLAKYQ